MGYDADTTVRIDGKQFEGKALLETRELVIRGPSRTVVPLAQVRKVEAIGGWLRLTTTRGLVELELGTNAGKWARRIASPPSRLDKLGVKPGMSVVLLGDPEDGFVEELEARGARVTRRAPPAPSAQIVFLLVHARDGLQRLGALKSSIVPDGAIWVLRRKGKTPVTEADSMAAGKRAGLVDVKVVAFSPILTAEKYVIPVARRGRTPRG